MVRKAYQIFVPSLIAEYGQFPLVLTEPGYFLFKNYWVVFFIFTQTLIDQYLSNVWRPWSDVAFSSVWSGSALLTCVLQKGRYAHMG